MKPMVAPLLVMATLLSAMNAAPPADDPKSQAVVTRLNRFIFSAYDGNPKNLAGMSFQINSADLRQPTEFLKLGEMIPRTKLKLVSFELITKPNPKSPDPDDVSELKVRHVETGKEFVLVLTKATNIPDDPK